MPSLCPKLKVGVEVHARVLSKSKLMSGSSASVVGGGSNAAKYAEPNTQVAWFDCAMPGAMPRLNKFCVEQAVRTGLGMHGNVQKVSVFERKHYFYADVPLGYQITQQTRPVVLVSRRVREHGGAARTNARTAN